MIKAYADESTKLNISGNVKFCYTGTINIIFDSYPSIYYLLVNLGTSYRGSSWAGYIGNFTRQQFRRHRSEMALTSQLALFDLKEQQLYSEPLPDDISCHPLYKKGFETSWKGNQFQALVSVFLFFMLLPSHKLVGQFIDQSIKKEYDWSIKSCKSLMTRRL